MTRRKAARAAAMAATTDGLESISVGGLAETTGVSKSGLLTVFGTREAIQLAAVAEAREIYLDHVIRPSLAEPAGRARLRALIEAWVAYQREDVFPGGCFIAATSVEFGSRSGPVADAVRVLRGEWSALLRDQLEVAGSPTPGEDAFRIDAFLTAANTMRRLHGDDAVLELARRFALEVVDRD